MGKIFTEHPDIALDFKPTKQEVKTAYMNVLLRVIKTLNKPPKSLSETRLNKASSELSELMDVGFKLDWLKSKLEEVSLERKKPDVDGYQVQQLEERINNIELMDIEFKLDCVNIKLDTSDESLVQQLDERVKDMSRKVGFKLDCLNTTIEERSLERKKSDDARFQQFEESVKNIELMVSCLKVELDKKKDKSTAEGFLLVD